MRRIATDRQNIEPHIIKEARYLALAVSVSPSTQEIRFLYPILGVEKKRREDLTKEQTGTGKIKNPKEPYWLFQLGEAFTLQHPVKKSFSRQFKVKITGAAALSEVDSWDELPIRYQMLSE